jgi:thiol:disulfide interchange protein DsbD
MIARAWWLPALATLVAAAPQTRPAPPPAAGQTRDPVRWSASIADPKRAVRAGDRVEIQLSATLDQGWHLYSLTPVPQGPSPTTIGLPAGQPFALAGDITEPLPQVKYDPNFDRETSFFEDAVTFVLPIKIEAAARPGAHTVNIAVSFQVCDSRLCLPPARLVVSAPLTITPSATTSAAGTTWLTR